VPILHLVVKFGQLVKLLLGKHWRTHPPQTPSINRLSREIVGTELNTDVSKASATLDVICIGKKLAIGAGLHLTGALVIIGAVLLIACVDLRL